MGPKTKKLNSRRFKAVLAKNKEFQGERTSSRSFEEFQGMWEP